jgi:hypothetical protein
MLITKIIKLNFIIDFIVLIENFVFFPFYSLKTNLLSLKFKPDFDSAADEYNKAGESFFHKET